MSQSILVTQPELEKKTIVVIRDDFTHKYLYNAKFVSLRVKLEKTHFVDLLVDFSKPYSSPDHLNPSEISDVEESWREITSGRSRRCIDVEEFLAELKR